MSDSTPDPGPLPRTHEVFNQSEPMAPVNLFNADRMLADAITRAGGEAHRQRLGEFGAECGGTEAQEWGRLANENPPKFKPFDRFGHRIDQVEFHPAYHALMDMGLDAGVSSAAWTTDTAPHSLHAALLIVMGGADAGLCCPMSMTYASVPALRQADWAGDWIERATSGWYEPDFKPMAQKRGVTIGMAMTEKQGGSDVRANETRAERIAGTEDEVRLTGHKWFCSAPMSDAFLTLAYEGEGETKGLSCFLVPRFTPDGKVNAIEIQRLKDKMGDRSNASSEIEYRGAWARRIGEPGKGVRTIIEMVNHTRLDCLAGSAGLIRNAAALSVWHADRRSAFQRRLIDQPLMRQVLAEMAMEAEAAIALAFRVARAFDNAPSDPAEAALARILTPIAKYWICKRAPAIAYEAMEAHGGVGYVEEFPLARLFRQSPLNAIWEGSGNVIALDVLRALGKDPAARDALLDALKAAKGANSGLDRRIAQLEGLVISGVGEADARRFVEAIALVLTAAILAQEGLHAAADAYVARRIDRAPITLGAGEGRIDEEALIDRARMKV